MIPADTGPSPCVIAVRALSAEVARALRGAGDAYSLADAPVPDVGTEAILAAVRVLGPDALAPYVLCGVPPRSGDAELVRAALRAYPAADPQPGGPPVARWRDWATTRLLGLIPDTPAPSAVGREESWAAWSVVVAQLAPLALWGLESPLHDEVRSAGVDLARAVTRAVLRRDYRMAARLARWLALAGEEPAAPVSLIPLLDHLDENAATKDPRILLDTAAARHLLGGTR